VTNPYEPTEEAIDRYLGDAKRSLRKAEFQEKLTKYLQREAAAPQLQPKWLDTLFEISIVYITVQAAVKAMDADGLERELKGRARLLNQVERMLVSGSAEVNRQSRNKGAYVGVLSRSLVRMIERWRTELDFLRAKERATDGRYATLRESAKTLHDYVWELDAYLNYVCKFEPEQRNVVIAGTLIAAGVISENEKDIVSIIPMRRSRAGGKFRAVEMCVDWIDQIPDPQEPVGT